MTMHEALNLNLFGGSKNQTKNKQLNKQTYSS